MEEARGVEGLFGLEDSGGGAGFCEEGVDAGEEERAAGGDGLGLRGGVAERIENARDVERTGVGEIDGGEPP